METAGTRSWRISEDRWPEALDVALWFRAAERIDVPAGGVVPGPAEIDPLPDRSAAPADMSELAAGWLAWWQALAGQLPLQEPLDPSRLPSELAFTGPPDFTGLAGWPVLRRVAAARWHEATQWHSQRRRAGLAAGPAGDLRIVHAVHDLERELRRPVKPFVLGFVVLPVRDDRIRPLRPGRYLIPERLRAGPRWPAPGRAGHSCSVSFCSRWPDAPPGAGDIQVNRN
ncbi:MAG: hypothetical protein ABSA53_08945 [Streptosporangiaceae bacterium]